jgi:hypothetical protein
LTLAWTATVIADGQRVPGEGRPRELDARAGDVAIEAVGASGEDARHVARAAGRLEVGGPVEARHGGDGLRVVEQAVEHVVRAVDDRRRQERGAFHGERDGPFDPLLEDDDALPAAGIG